MQVTAELIDDAWIVEGLDLTGEVDDRGLGGGGVGVAERAACDGDQQCRLAGEAMLYRQEWNKRISASNFHNGHIPLGKSKKGKRVLSSIDCPAASTEGLKWMGIGGQLSRQ